VRAYLDIYGGVSHAADHHNHATRINIVNEAMYSQYKEKSRKYIILQQQKARKEAKEYAEKIKASYQLLN
jgi:hypothetical protein